MDELEKQAKKHKLAASLAERLADNPVSRGLNHAIYGPASAVAAAPGRVASNSLGGLLFGSRESNPMSPVYGKRLKAVPGTGGLEEISKAEYEAIKQRGGGKAYKFKGEGHINPIYYKRKYVPGGATGFIRKHPLLAGGGALLAYYLAKSPENRQLAQSLLPRSNTDISPEVIKQWREPNVENPFQRRAWG